MIMHLFISLIFPQNWQQHSNAGVARTIHRFKPHRKCLISYKKNSSCHVHTNKSVDELYEKILDIWTSYTGDYVKTTCMHQSRQKCAEFNRPAGKSQNIKVTPCFLHFIDLSKILDIFCSFMHISIYLCNLNSTKILFITSNCVCDNKMAPVLVRILLSTFCILNCHVIPSHDSLKSDSISKYIYNSLVNTFIWYLFSKLIVYVLTAVCYRL